MWPMGLGTGADVEVAPTVFGEERPDAGKDGMGRAELGVVEVDVGAVEADNRLVEEDMGV